MKQWEVGECETDLWTFLQEGKMGRPWVHLTESQKEKPQVYRIINEQGSTAGDTKSVKNINKGIFLNQYGIKFKKTKRSGWNSRLSQTAKIKPRCPLLKQTHDKWGDWNGNKKSSS